MLVEETQVSSDIFIRRFMNSKIAKMIDRETILETTIQPQDLLREIEEQYEIFRRNRNDK